MKEKMRDFFMIFGITLALFGIFNNFDSSDYIWWVMGLATIFFVIITLVEFSNLFSKTQ